MKNFENVLVSVTEWLFVRMRDLLWTHFVIFRGSTQPYRSGYYVSCEPSSHINYMHQKPVQYLPDFDLRTHITHTLSLVNANHLSQSHRKTHSNKANILFKKFGPKMIQNDALNSVMVQKLAVSPCPDRRSRDALMLPWQKFVQQDRKSMFSAKDEQTTAVKYLFYLMITLVPSTVWNDIY